MKKHPLFKYSLTYKVFLFSGAFLLILLVISAIIVNIGFMKNYPATNGILLFLQSINFVYWWILSILVVFGICLGLFLKYVTFPLEKVAEQIMSLLLGNPYNKIPPERNDEIGIISHFFNKVSDKIQDLSLDLEDRKRMSSELAMASKIQSDILPTKAPDNIIGLDIVAKSRASSEVGGDCFDFLTEKDDTLIYIGDVTGHGVSAGLVMMIVSTTLRTLVEQNVPIKEAVAKTNDVLRERISSNHFMSFVLLRWQNYKQKLSFIGAGHEYILHYSKRDKEVYLIKSGGIALKMIPNLRKVLQEKPIDFLEGDAVLLYTDGITEAKNKQGKMYEVERLKAIFLQYSHRRTADMFDKITDDFSSFLGENPTQIDDITMIIIKNIGQHSATQAVKLSINTQTDTKIIHTKVWDWN